MSSSPIPKKKVWLRWLLVPIFLLTLAGLSNLWIQSSLDEFTTGRRSWPWGAYDSCGKSTPDKLPSKIRIGLYEEFPNPWRLAKLSQLDFPVTLAIATPSRAEFERIRGEIMATYPQVKEVVFWPVLSPEEGYYPGLWSNPQGIQRVIGESTDLPLLWDLEVPRGATAKDIRLDSRWWENRAAITDMLKSHSQPIHIWRTHVGMGLDSAFLRLLGMYIDPVAMPNARLHLDFYTTGAGQNAQELAQIMRCGVERYGERFVPSLGVLNDNEGPAEIFIPVDTLRRNLQIARDAGVSEIWLFGSNGLNPEYLDAIRATLPVK